MNPGDLGRIVDFETRFENHPRFRGFTQRDFVEWFLYHYNQQAAVKVVLEDPRTAIPSSSVMHNDRSRPEGRAAAYINPLRIELAPLPVGRWLTNCPWCHSSEYVDFRTGLFMCCECWNASIGYHWLQIKLPNPGLRRAVERLLLVRDPENRHWRPYETLAEVRMENIKRGLSV